jgi:hypothetical protein
MFENRMLRRIFGPKKDEMAGEWRKLHNEGLNPRITEQKNFMILLYCVLFVFLYAYFLIIVSTFVFLSLIPGLI